ncbi:FAD/NAD(P)-binding domain-containing protein [Gonapodya prolifera JEL478]|uniref:FAD/NAD(P)-binding domain-containing protein n=1 Tax=Gonapodya prolifera (strain JEL478) TaxID=1344416 RepID=A0A139A0J6_GONPJ|nr:FAD/NAD(P)-binding domain-containing protein [Gonapodya prolifera JEL478]|eukprot:KXS10244.1 FAD/NAD(P)-binding domain-containing protein [Gonapodya prolifera JEL478]
MGFKAIIVGGSISGLTTALLLEKAGIDYVVLESRDIAPPVGASLGLWPNGFRILDQLGIYEQIMEITVPTFKTYMLSRGKTLARPAPDEKDIAKETYGYSSCFLDRQYLIQILHKNIANKDKVLTQVKINSIDQTDEGVTVTCADGTVYTGDVVVGADGVHSFVRGEMWRSMEKDDPTLLPPGEKTAITVTFSAMFGIAKDVPGVEAGGVYMAHQEQSQLMTVGGKDGRCFFFIFKRLGKVYTAPDLPKFTEADRDQVAEFHRNHKVNEVATFGNIWDRKIIGTYLPLEESSFTKYAYKRIVMIGDSIHKPTPASGQGGNGAIESAAVFANLLVRALARHKFCKEPHLSLDDAVGISEEYSTMREARMNELIKTSHVMNEYSLWPAHVLSLVEFVLPLIPSSLAQMGMKDMLFAPLAGGPHVEFLPLPQKKGQWADMVAR